MQKFDTASAVACLSRTFFNILKNENPNLLILSSQHSSGKNIKLKALVAYGSKTKTDRITRVYLVRFGRVGVPREF